MDPMGSIFYHMASRLLDSDTLCLRSLLIHSYGRLGHPSSLHEQRIESLDLSVQVQEYLSILIVLVFDYLRENDLDSVHHTLFKGKFFLQFNCLQVLVFLARSYLELQLFDLQRMRFTTYLVSQLLGILG